MNGKLNYTVTLSNNDVTYLNLVLIGITKNFAAELSAEALSKLVGLKRIVEAEPRKRNSFEVTFSRADTFVLLAALKDHYLYCEMVATKSVIDELANSESKLIFDPTDYTTYDFVTEEIESNSTKELLGLMYKFREQDIKGKEATIIKLATKQ